MKLPVVSKTHGQSDAELPSGGFSIVELLVAIVVGTVFVLSANVAITNYLHLGQQSKSLVLANSFVEGKVEELRNIGYNGLVIGTSDITSSLPSELKSPRSASLQISSPSSGIKEVDINLSYTEQGTRNYSYTTYVGELGVGQ